jgi:hypothetical protein
MSAATVRCIADIEGQIGASVSAMGMGDGVAVRRATTNDRTLPSGPRGRPPHPTLLVNGDLSQQIDQRLGLAFLVSPLSRAKVRTLARP